MPCNTTSVRRNECRRENTFTHFRVRSYVAVVCSYRHLRFHVSLRYIDFERNTTCSYIYSRSIDMQRCVEKNYRKNDAHPLVYTRYVRYRDTLCVTIARQITEARNLLDCLFFFILAMCSFFHDYFFL